MTQGLEWIVIIKCTNQCNIITHMHQYFAAVMKYGCGLAITKPYEKMNSVVQLIDLVCILFTREFVISRTGAKHHVHLESVACYFLHNHTHTFTRHIYTLVVKMHLQ